MRRRLAQQAGRETGILRNRLYIGELVWNRHHWLKDPTTSRRVARANDEQMLVTEQVPELRIIDQPLWDKVKARLKARHVLNASLPTREVPIISGISAVRAIS